jgi:TRAP-type C4-dicarboxylate transport system substrate-binding protein
VVIKTASLMPEASPWTRALRNLAREITTQTTGEVTFKIYAGGVAGDEADVLRKMRVNRIHAAGFTGFGLGLILPEMRVLESPLLFKNHKELDHVKDALFDYFAAGFSKKGYVLLGIVDGGFVYFFSKRDLSVPAHWHALKMWIWKGDPVAENFLTSFGINAYPLHVSDVNTGLETGMIDSFYAPPAGAVAFQWFWRVQYMLDLPIVYSTGGFLMNRNTFTALSEEHQAKVQSVTRAFCAELNEITRQANAESLSVLQDAGIKMVRPSGAQLKRFEKSAGITVEKNTPRLFSRGLYKKVQVHLTEFRGDGKPGAAPAE